MKLLIKQIWNKIKPFKRGISIFLDILFLLIWIVNLIFILPFSISNVTIQIDSISLIIGIKMIILFLFSFLFLIKNKILNGPISLFTAIFWFIFLITDCILFSISLLYTNLKLFFLTVDLILIIFLFLNSDLPLTKYLNYSFKRHKIFFSTFIFIILFITSISTSIIFSSNKNYIPLNYSWQDVFLKIISSGLTNDFEIPQSYSILFTAVVIINSLCFFLFGLLFAQSIFFTFKNRHKIFMDSYVKSYANKKIIFNFGILYSDLNNQKFIKEFSSQFSNYYDETEETWMKNYWIFNKNDTDFFKCFLNEIKEKIGDKRYNKYIHIKDEENKIIMLKQINWISNKLAKLDFYKNFSSLYEIKIKNLDDTNVKKNINDLISKYSVPCYIDEKNLSIKSHFSFKNCFENNIKMENFTDNKILRRYSFKLDDCNKIATKDIIENVLLEIYNKSFFKIKEIKWGFKISFYTHYRVDDKRQEIGKLINDLNEKNKWSLKMKKYKSCLEYWTDSEQEREQIFIKMNLYGNSFKLRKRNEDVKPTEINPENTSNYLKKVIIRSNSESKLDQSFKNELFNFFGSDNILDFEEKIYLNKSSLWELTKEKYSFQFILNTSSLDEKQLKEFNNLMIKHNSSFNKYKFFSNLTRDQKNLELEYTILYLNPLEKWS